MLIRQRAITRMFTNVLQDMDHREPSSRDWAVAKRVCKVLERPCKLVMKSQDKGHWLLPQALDRICRLFVESQQRLAELRAVPPPPPGSIDQPLDEVEATMLTTWVEHLEKFLAPLTAYDPTKAHIAMALLCDHRHRRGEIFYWMTSVDLPATERLQVYNKIMHDYSSNLIDAMVAMKLGDQRSGEAPTQQPTPVWPNACPASTPFSVPDILLPCDVLSSAGPGVERSVAEERTRVEARLELERFRCKAAVKESDMDICPLKWWRTQDHLYPMLANVAKIALCCPGSQIECERVFSLCGLTVSLLRNRMTTDNLAQIVYLTKNTKQLAAMQHILSKTHGSINTEHWLGQMENNAYVNAPMPETCVPDPDTLDLLDSNEVPPEEGTEDECVFETPHDWEEVVGDPVADDDDGSLPF